MNYMYMLRKYIGVDNQECIFKIDKPLCLLEYQILLLDTDLKRRVFNSMRDGKSELLAGTALVEVFKNDDLLQEIVIHDSFPSPLTACKVTPNDVEPTDIIKIKVKRKSTYPMEFLAALFFLPRENE